MKYVVFTVLMIIIILLVTPIMIIKWNSRGLEEILEGLKDICGMDYIEE